MSPADRSASAPPGAAKGIVVIAVAVVLGFVLLARGGGGSLIDTGSSSASKSSTTVNSNLPSLPAETTTTAPPPTNAPASVSVAIFNGTGGANTTAAGDNRAKLTPAGYTTVQIGDTTTTATSVIYYANGAGGDARAIAALLNLPAKVPQPIASAASLPAGVQGASVIVIVGQDSVAGAGKTGTAATN